MASPEELIQVLTEIRAHLAVSSSSDWAALEPEEITRIVDREIASLRATRRLRDATELSSLFLPTAEMQEIAMTSGWGDRYLELASRFDDAMRRDR